MVIQIKFAVVSEQPPYVFIFSPALEHGLNAINGDEEIQKYGKQLVQHVLENRTFNKPVSELGWSAENGKLTPPNFSDEEVKQRINAFFNPLAGKLERVVTIEIDVPDEHLSSGTYLAD